MSDIITYRISRNLYLKKVPLLPTIFRKLTRLIYSCDIPFTAKIHESVRFPHDGLGVVIGHDSEIGKNTKILHNVTIGGKSGIRANPIIGSNVLIGAGACVLGDVTVGDNAQIGAQSVVINDVPNNAVVVGIPAKIIKYI